MQKILLLVSILIFGNYSFAQSQKKFQHADSSFKFYKALASCGSCNFKMKGKGCFLAIQLNGKNYFVQGAGIDDFGDAHDKDGFCNAARKVTIQGEIKEDNFFLSYLKFD